MSGHILNVVYAESALLLIIQFDLVLLSFFGVHIVRI